MVYARFHICRSTNPVSSWQTKWRTKVQAFVGEAHNPLRYLVDYDLQVAEEKTNCEEVREQTKEEILQVKDVT